MDYKAEGQKIIETVRWTCLTLGVPDLFNKIEIQWNSRFTRRLGDAEWKPLKNIGIVRFSVPLWPRATEEERKNNVIHEVCHVAANYIYKLREKPGRRNPHGSEWKHLMRQCGRKPHRTHKIDRTGLKRTNTRTKYKVACKCRELLIGPTRYKRMKQGSVYVCRLCGGKIHPIMRAASDSAD